MPCLCLGDRGQRHRGRDRRPLRGRGGEVGRFVRPPSTQEVPRVIEEEDEVEEIRHKEAQPHTIHIFRKWGEEVIVVEEEDTTRVVKRLRSTLNTAMKQIEVSMA